ncbi:hypothetical protein [Paenibacillus wynnii]|uniref:Uncharacterized protein n=1 Tax=Paenibacillus wynnii TaxID=268407 RepID=A0A098M9H3_9BACL|nr:hypothetical protein [Paenibacillus wynnii]KGE19199.1 hypothetical protein PWYN_07425 [Paenibacillus wynnii]
MFLESLGFMFFSTIETISVYYLIMSLFRLKARDYIWEALFIVLLVNLQSYVLRNEFSLAYLVPIIGILIFIFLFAVIVKIPLVWSMISTILGYAIFGIMQTGLAILLFGSIAGAMSTTSNGYLLQFASGLITSLLAWFIFKIGWGFKFDFERLRFRFEDILVIVLISVFLVFISVILYYNQIFIDIIFFVSTVVFLLYYAIWKEMGK